MVYIGHIRLFNVQHPLHLGPEIGTDIHMIARPYPIANGLRRFLGVEDCIAVAGLS